MFSLLTSPLPSASLQLFFPFSMPFYQVEQDLSKRLLVRIICVLECVRRKIGDGYSK